MSYVSKTLITTEPEPAVNDKRLSICLLANGFSFSVTTGDGQLLTFGEAEGGHAKVMTAAIADVKAFFAEVGIRPLGYKSMELIVMSDNCTWVPNELYSSAANRQYLHLVGCDAVSVMSTPCDALASTAVYEANDQLAMGFKVALPGLVVMNQHVKMVQLAPRSVDHPVLFTHWRQGRVDVAAFRDGRYIYGNTLRFDSGDEIRFRIVEVMKTFGIESPNTELMMCGDVDRELFARLRPYFPATTLYTGNAARYSNPAFKGLHTYRHALILM